jgi:DNA repair protein RecO (recombination protein O)
MGDMDKMVTLLTPGLGKIGCAARGARRPKSALMAGTQYLCFGDYVLYEGANNYSINSCDIIEVFYNLRTDLDKLQCAADITKIVKDVTTENENNYKTLQLLLNTLYMISETDMNKDLITSIFEMRLVSIIGYTPEINKCVICGEQSNLTHFSIRDNGFKCQKCSKQDTGAITMHEGTKNSIKYTIMAPAKKIFGFKTTEESIKEFKLISKIYLNEKLVGTF